MERKIVLCVGDSLGMAREELQFKHTWQYLLASKYHNYLFVNNFHRALTTKKLLKRDFLENYNPDIVVLQIGIVDCAPRYHKSTALWPKLANRLPGSLQKTFWRFFKKYNKRKNQYADVLPNDFKRHLISYFDRCKAIGVEKAIVVLIHKPGSRMIVKNPTVLENIAIYNAIFRDVAKAYDFIELVNPLGDAMDSDYIEDGYHVSSEGANKVFESLKDHFSHEY